ncbi:MAG: hypothetical protein J7J94_04285 [Thaumarchaeota archaeon]|nr:hypothetical protein [Nitrososphaerota archaeon]
MDVVAGLSDEEITREAVKIVEAAKERGVILRILGAIAIRLHSRGYEEFHKQLGRLGDAEKSFTDIDLIGYSSQHGDIRKLMEKELSFYISRQFLLMHGKDRLIYYHPQNLYHVDIFFDKLAFSHDVPFGKKGKGRLELDYPTITVTDLLLEKLQIHEINEKDIKDIIVLLKAHELGHSDEDQVNLDYLAQLLGDDWGFWKDATDNLKKTLAFAEKYREASLISGEDYRDIEEKVEKILEVLESCPKSKRWRKGEKQAAKKKKYWRDVEELYR